MRLSLLSRCVSTSSWAGSSTKKNCQQPGPKGVASVVSFDVRDQLGKVSVPTLLLTPADDHLVGEQAARELREGLSNAREVVRSIAARDFFAAPGPKPDTGFAISPRRQQEPAQDPARAGPRP